MTPQNLGYGDVLARNGLLYAERTALSGAAARCTHRELWQRSQAMAQVLAGHHIGPGDRFAVLSNNRFEVFELLGAAALLGAIVVFLNIRSSPGEIAAIVADIEPRLLVTEPEHDALLQELPPDLPCYSLAIETTRLHARAEFMEPRSSASLTSVSASAPLIAIPTAAVDSRPRLALLSQRAVITQAFQLAYTWQLGPEDRHLCVLPLFHMAGLGLAIAAQVAGGASVIMPRFVPVEAVRLIDANQVSFFASFSPMLGAILEEARPDQLASLRVVTGLESPEVIQRFEARCRNARFWSGYGQTETGGMITLAPAQEHPGSAGHLLPLVAVRIEDTSGQIASPDQIGEILVRSPSVFDRYWNRPGETTHAARGGWHHTGDLGRLDTDGYLWFVGRSPDKLLIKSGGENIYPAEVEQALLSHPAVAQAVVFGVTDSRWGEAVRAVCVLAADASATADELAAHAGLRIARFKRPRDIVFVDALPLLADGSPDRQAIRRIYGDNSEVTQ
ncbi:MAG: AMP-binding protein [Rhodocyclales bacterium]|nr:AMP-binding protein [Rhodocyclales bacterium]